MKKLIDPEKMFEENNIEFDCSRGYLYQMMYKKNLYYYNHFKKTISYPGWLIKDHIEMLEEIQKMFKKGWIDTTLSDYTIKD